MKLDTFDIQGYTLLWPVRPCTKSRHQLQPVSPASLQLPGQPGVWSRPAELEAGGHTRDCKMPGAGAVVKVRLLTLTFCLLPIMTGDRLHVHTEHESLDVSHL